MTEAVDIEITDEFIEGWKAFKARKLDDGTIVMLKPMLFTWALMYDVGEISFGGRFCFETLIDAYDAYMNYKGDDPDEVPEGAIKGKGYKKVLPGQTYPEMWV